MFPWLNSTTELYDMTNQNLRTTMHTHQTAPTHSLGRPAFCTLTGITARSTNTRTCLLSMSRNS